MKASAASRSGNDSIPTVRNLLRTSYRQLPVIFSAMPCRHFVAAPSSCIFTMKLSSKRIPLCRWMQFVNKWAGKPFELID